MRKKYKIGFQETKCPITEPVTKFGGQPVWIEKPEWAISKTTGKPMMFICQIALDKEIFGEIESKMAYIFIEDNDAMSITWEADGGDNAVIIQPNGNNFPSTDAETGKTLYVMKEPSDSFSDKIKRLFSQPRRKKREPFSCEFAVNLDIGNDKNSFTGKEKDKMLSENKIGGTPVFLQGEVSGFNEKEGWKPLLQLDSGSVPFHINLGDAGIGYAFISNDGKTGKFLWQCS